jgi:vacuolar-type H+-ATPase subunit C/Vma6
MKGDYAQLLEKTSAEYPNALHLAKVFRSLLVTRCYHLVGIAPEKCRTFMEAYLERFLVEDMRRILRAKHAGNVVERGSLIPIPKGYDRVGLQALVDAATMEDAVGLLAKSKFALGEAMPIYEKYRLVSILEAFLEKTYYDSEVRPTLKGLPGQGTIEDLVATEVDLTDVEKVADLRARKVAVEAVKALAHEPMRLTPAQLASISATTPESIPQIISKTRYSALTQPLQDALESGKDESLDHVLRLEVFKRTKAMMVPSSDTFAYVLAYMREAETECNNLVSIGTGKELGLPEARIQAAVCTG